MEMNCIICLLLFIVMMIVNNKTLINENMMKYKNIIEPMQCTDGQSVTIDESETIAESKDNTFKITSDDLKDSSLSDSITPVTVDDRLNNIRNLLKYQAAQCIVLGLGDEDDKDHGSCGGVELINIGSGEIIVNNVDSIKTELVKQLDSLDENTFMEWFYSHKRTILLYYILLIVNLNSDNDNVMKFINKHFGNKMSVKVLKKGFLEENEHLKNDLLFLNNKYDNIAEFNGYIKWATEHWQKDILDELNEEEKIQMMKNGNMDQVVQFYEEIDSLWYNGMKWLRDNDNQRLHHVSEDIMNIYDERKKVIKEKSDEMDMIAGNRKRMAELKGERDSMLNSIYDRMIYVYLFLLFLSVAVYVDSRIDKVYKSDGSLNWRFIVGIVLILSVMVYVPWNWTVILLWIMKVYKNIKNELGNIQNIYVSK